MPCSTSSRQVDGYVATPGNRIDYGVLCMLFLMELMAELLVQMPSDNGLASHDALWHDLLALPSIS